MDWLRRLLPEVGSAHGAEIDQVIGLVHGLMLLLFVIWGGLFVYMLVRFRRGRHPEARYDGLKSKASTWGEVGVVLAEVVLLVGFSIPLYSARVDAVPTEAVSTVVRVIGEQYAWNVHYPGPDGVFGRTSPALVDAETNPLGLDDDDPASADDITGLNQLHVPVGKPVLIYLGSKDVIHGFWLPEMRVKQDAIPGERFPVWFEPTVTTDAMRARTGNPRFYYAIACAQLCGLGHYSMDGRLTVHTPEAWQAWMDDQQARKAEVDDFWN